MSKSHRYNNDDQGFIQFKMKKPMPAHKLRDDLREQETRSLCAQAKKGVISDVP